jgi:gluconate 5-dehydrogenase
MINELFDLNGKVALITGGTHGIGMAIGITLGRAGAKICINDLMESRLQEAKAKYKEAGIDVFTIVFDVTDEAQVDSAISTIEKEVGTIDILVNNAGIIKRIPILDMPISDFRQVIDVDLVAPLIVAKRVAPGMIAKRSGKIINMCSMMSIYGRNSVSAYASAKGGVKATHCKYDLRMGQIQCPDKWNRSGLYCYGSNCPDSRRKSSV